MELFYDLVFVLAISKFKNIFEHSDHSPINYIDFFKFALVLIILLRIWIVKTLSINKYGKNTAIEKIFISLDIGIIMYMANSINSEWSQSFKIFTIATSFIFFSFTLQNIYYWFKNKENTDYKKVFIINISHFLIMGSLLIGFAFLPYNIGIYLIIGLMALSWLSPWNIKYRKLEQKINLPHLIERLNLLTIIFFGEMLIVISHYFTHLDWKGILGMFFVGNLFMYYIHFFEKLIDHHKNAKFWYIMISIHILIYWVLSLITLNFEFNLDNKLSEITIWVICYVSLIIYIISLNSLRMIFPKTLQERKKTIIGLAPILFLTLVCVLGVVLADHLNIEIRFIITSSAFALVHLDVKLQHWGKTRKEKANLSN